MDATRRRYEEAKDRKYVIDRISAWCCFGALGMIFLAYLIAELYRASYGT